MSIKSENIVPVQSQVSRSSRAESLGVSNFKFRGSTLWFTGLGVRAHGLATARERKGRCPIREYRPRRAASVPAHV